MIFRHRELPWTPIIILLWVAFYALAPVWASFTESRTYRDLVRLTPFHDVTIERVEIDGNSLKIWGSLIKDRCQRVEVTAWARDAKGFLRLAEFRSGEAQDGRPINRPVSPNAQLFGPWIITPYGDFKPAGALMFISHSCPEGLVSNLVFDIAWEEAP